MDQFNQDSFPRIKCCCSKDLHNSESCPSILKVLSWAKFLSQKTENQLRELDMAYQAILKRKDTKEKYIDQIQLDVNRLGTKMKFLNLKNIGKP